MNTYLLKNNSNLTIRPAVPGDASDMLAYIDICAGQSDYLTFQQGERYITVEEERKLIENFSTGKNGLCLIAELNGIIVGNLVFRLGQRSKISHAGEFGISVLKSHWNLGIGRLLLQELLTWAQNTGFVRKINLRVRVDNESGLALYTKMGFLQEGLLRREFYQNGCFYDAYFMGLCLDSQNE
jgi:RimJ/RimL family protein N-acetyltransferase